MIIGIVVSVIIAMGLIFCALVYENDSGEGSEG